MDNENRRTEPLTTVDDLIHSGLVQIEDASSLEKVGAALSIRITPETLALIDPSNPNDPIGKQYVPSIEELNILAEELDSPIGDDRAEVLPGLLRKYPDRVLIKLVNVCATYCRFCFRREDIGDGQGLINETAFQAIVDFIDRDPSIWEVILSGGDPLILAPAKLHSYLERLSAIEHVQSLRIHSRVPIVSPSIVNQEFLASLKVSKTVWLALHCNHPKELTSGVRSAIRQLVDAGVPLLSQTVLLKGINDDERILAQLFRDLSQLRVKPFQLHHGDLAKGTNHFRLSLRAGQEIFRNLTRNISSVCLPMYMLEIPGGFGKISAAEAQLTSELDGEWLLLDANGIRHVYSERP